MKDTTSLSLGRETFLSMGSKVVMAALGFIGIVVFARVLGPDGLGIYQTSLAVALVLSQLSAGTGTALKKRVSEVGVEPDEYLGAGLLIHGAFTLVLTVLYILFSSTVNDYFNSTAVATVTLAVVFAFGSFTIVNRLYSGLGYPSMSSWIDSVRSLLTLAFQFLFLYFDYGAFGLVAGFVIGTLLSALVSAAAAGVVPSPPGRETLRRVYEFARWSVSNSLLSKGYGRADILLINGLVGSGAVGLYATAGQLGTLGSMFGGSISDALSVKSSGRDSAGESIQEDLTNSVAYAGLISVPVFFGALAIPQALMETVFGSEFSAGASALVGMALFQALDVYRLPFEAAAQGLDRPDFVFRNNVGVFLIYLPLAVYLGMRYGLLGIIGASIFGEVARLSVFQYFFRQRFGKIVFPRPVLDQAASSVVMLGVVSGVVPGIIQITNWFWLVVAVGVGALAYFTTLLTISVHFRETIRSVLGDTFDVGA